MKKRGEIEGAGGKEKERQRGEIGRLREREREKIGNENDIKIFAARMIWKQRP